MAIVQGQLQGMLVNEQLRKIEDFILKILNIPTLLPNNSHLFWIVKMTMI
jgi:hypothetical protein